jgi:hypothetical protein
MTGDGVRGSPQKSGVRWWIEVSMVGRRDMVGVALGL